MSDPPAHIGDDRTHYRWIIVYTPTEYLWFGPCFFRQAEY